MVEGMKALCTDLAKQMWVELSSAEKALYAIEIGRKSMTKKEAAENHYNRLVEILTLISQVELRGKIHDR